MDDPDSTAGDAGQVKIETSTVTGGEMVSDKNRFFPVVLKLTGAVSLPIVAVVTLLWVVFGTTKMTFSGWVGLAALIVLPVFCMAAKYAVDKLHQELTDFYWQQRLSLEIELQSLLPDQTADETSECARENASKALRRRGFVMLNVEHELEEVTK